MTVGYGYTPTFINNSNLVVVSGSSSSLNASTLTVGQIGYAGNSYVNSVMAGNALVISNGATVYANNLAISAFGGIVGSSSNNVLSNNYVIVNGGNLYATTKLTIGNGSNEQGYVSILNGGLLEANSISNSTTVAGSCYITNNGGIYQFSTPVPTFVPNGGGNITLNNGWISFRAVTNVNVMLNWFTTALTFSGANTFRLNAATNTAAADQTYVFDPGLGATNYAGLEMINGGTCYRGLAGSTLTIGTGLGSGATMLCSNTAALVAVPFTNNGTLTLFNSTLTFATNATFNGALRINADHLLSLTGTVLASNLTLGASSSLIVTGAGTNATLATYTALSGGFSSITAPFGYGISVANGKVRLLKTSGTSCFFR